MNNLAEQAAHLNSRGLNSRGLNPRGLNPRAREQGHRRKRATFALLTDRERLPDPVPLLHLLPTGGLLVLRHYGAPDREDLARRLAQICRARRLTLVIADDFELAMKLGAGLHLPETRARVAGARIRLWHRRGKRMLTVAAHSRQALVRAAALNVDAALLSPVFTTRSHPNARPLGALQFRVLTRGAKLSIWALGEIDGHTIRALRASGAAGIATVGGLTTKL